MKVTRLRSGYSIRLSDSEFGLMQSLLADVLSGEVDDGGLTPAEKRVLRSDRWRGAGTPLVVDENRRLAD